MSAQPHLKLIILIRTALLCVLLLAFRPENQAQNIPEPPIADLAQTGLLNDLSDHTYFYFSDNKNIPINQLPYLPYRKGTRKYEHFLSPTRINQKTVLRFTLTNSSDRPQSAFFCPGFLIDTIRIYRLVDQSPAPPKAEPLLRVLPEDPDSLGYRKITLAPHENGTFYA